MRPGCRQACYAALSVLAAACSLPALAELYEFESWGWSDEDADFHFAVTINDAGRFFGQYCYFDSGDCMYLLNDPHECEPEGEHVALISTDVGAIHGTLVCSHKYEENYVYMVGPFEDVDNAVRQGSRIGIVMPLEGDDFAVVRFGLAGSVDAIDAMRDVAQKKMAKTPSRPPDVEVL